MSNSSARQRHCGHAAHLFTQTWSQGRDRADPRPLRSASCTPLPMRSSHLAQSIIPASRHINGDVYHMQSEERHIGEAICRTPASSCVNLHIADSNRCALGEGSLDVWHHHSRALCDRLQPAGGRFVTFEPLGPGGDPYPAMHGKPDKAKLDALVCNSIRYFRECEEIVLAE